MQKAIQEAKKMRDEGCGPNDENAKWFLNKLIERLERMPQDNGWISVLDRLPEEGTEIIWIEKDGWRRVGVMGTLTFRYGGFSILTEHCSFWKLLLPPQPPHPYHT